MLKLKRTLNFALIAALGFSAQGCLSSLIGEESGYDGRIIKIQTVSLFNQRTPSRLAKKNWKGDWIFRRDRLDLVDAELKNSKPDLLVMQELMAKEGGSAEADSRILGAGALAEYEWRSEKVEAYEDTHEEQSLSVAVALPSRLVSAQQAEAGGSGDGREVWRLGSGGYLMAATVEYEDQPLTVLNVQMPTQGEDSALWYSFIQERVQERVKRLKLCSKRVILAGLIPGDAVTKRFGEMLTALQLKDSSTGFCQVASRCYTATPTNDLYLATIGDESPTRVDKVFVHQSSIVYTSSRNFEGSDPNNRYARQFGLTSSFPTQRFGWASSVRLARCARDELGL